MKLLLLATLVACGLLPFVSASRFVCYFPNWSVQRQGKITFSPFSASVIGFEFHWLAYIYYCVINFTDPWQFGVDQIDTRLCTHLVYAFAELDDNTFQIRPSLPEVDIDQDFYRKFTGLKTQNPRLKTMLAFGGWVDSNVNDKYSQLVSSSQNIDTFVRSAVQLLTDFAFDGLDVDWEYPKTEADKTGFANLLEALKRAFAQRGFLLSVAVAGAENNLGRL